ncbi:hypothetical protein CT0861_00436 [Colletotrichum tofieldiae]|uniref:Uncharacterized protein n=1 Tax=Colletotrichum tofieldiae TaxID=708197 RepID=A0A166R897_9PEZI|nr:hypothetical protein CT0861_00436 [Colletotrichum tofieldiae]
MMTQPLIPYGLHLPSFWGWSGDSVSLAGNFCDSSGIVWQPRWTKVTASGRVSSHESIGNDFVQVGKPTGLKYQTERSCQKGRPREELFVSAVVMEDRLVETRLRRPSRHLSQLRQNLSLEERSEN